MFAHHEIDDGNGDGDDDDDDGGDNDAYDAGAYDDDLTSY